MNRSYRSLAAEAIRSKDSDETKASAAEVGPNVTLSDISFELDSEARKLIEAERSKARDALRRK
jgi:hypothetical protein